MGHTIQKIRDDFAFHLERERNLSVHTIRAYLGDGHGDAAHAA